MLILYHEIILFIIIGNFVIEIRIFYNIDEPIYYIMCDLVILLRKHFICIFNIRCTVCSIQCTMQCKVYTIYCTPDIPCTRYIIPSLCSMFIVYNALATFNS